MYFDDKNRELSMMKALKHSNVVTLYNSFFSETENVGWNLFYVDVIGRRVSSSCYGIHS